MSLVAHAASVVTLLLAGLTDPGVFKPVSEKKDELWTWSEQGKSYRPPGVVYCRESQVLIEGYDIFCPWIGTVVGRKNSAYFRAFRECLTLAVLVDAFVVYGLPVWEGAKVYVPIAILCVMGE